MVDLIFGIGAGLCVVASLMFKCVTTKSNIIMRAINSVGCILFVAYGAILWYQDNGGWSLVMCNGLLLIFNIYHIIRLCLTFKKQPNESLSPLPDIQENTTGEETNAKEEILREVKQLADKCESIDQLRAELAKLN